MSRPVPTWARLITAGAVLVVSAVAAVVSFCHMQHLATEAGEEWRAGVLPLSVDGLLVAASLVIFVRRRAGRRVGGLPWVGLLLGVSASVAANIAAAQPAVLGRVVAAWPPVAFALSFELLVVLLRDSTAHAFVDAAELPGDEINSPFDADDMPDFWANAPYAQTPEGRAAKLIENGAGRRRLARELDISEHAARQLLGSASVSVTSLELRQCLRKKRAECRCWMQPCSPGGGQAFAIAHRRAEDDLQGRARCLPSGRPDKRGVADGRVAAAGRPAGRRRDVRPRHLLGRSR
jgi:hypothetical protein